MRDFIPAPNRSLTSSKARKPQILPQQLYGFRPLPRQGLHPRRPRKLLTGLPLCGEASAVPPTTLPQCMEWDHNTWPYAMAAILRHSPCVRWPANTPPSIARWDCKYFAIHVRWDRQNSTIHCQIGLQLLHQPSPDGNINTNHPSPNGKANTRHPSPDGTANAPHPSPDGTAITHHPTPDGTPIFRHPR